MYLSTKIVSFNNTINKPDITGLGDVLSIHTKNIKLDVDSYGAKVLGLHYKAPQTNKTTNILFYDNEDIKHSGIPICFPSFGPLTDNKLDIDKNSFKMGQHGFIRDSIFKVEQTDKNTITCTFKSTEKTKQLYPYDFEFKAVYSITNQGLSMKFVVKNNSDSEMKFAPGVHPYFTVSDPQNISLTSNATSGNDNKNNYEITTIANSKVLQASKSNIHANTLEIKGLPDLHLNNHTLPETLIFTGHENHFLKMTFDPDVFKRLTVWRGKEDAGYICVEPANEQNALNSAYNNNEYKGAIILPPDQEWTTEVIISVISR